MLDFFKRRPQNVKNDVLSGLTVALALVPEAVAFAFVAGVSPVIGLYSAFFIGLLAAVVGGRPGMISGATGAMAVVVVSLVAMYGVEYLFPTVILCGILQILVGIGKLGKLIRMVPASVMLGFVNGLAIVIGLAQLGSFKTLSNAGDLVFLTGTPLLVMLGLVGPHDAHHLGPAEADDGGAVVAGGDPGRELPRRGGELRLRRGRIRGPWGDGGRNVDGPRI